MVFTIFGIKFHSTDILCKILRIEKKLYELIKSFHFYVKRRKKSKFFHQFQVSQLISTSTRSKNVLEKLFQSFFAVVKYLTLTICLTAAEKNEIFHFATSVFYCIYAHVHLRILENAHRDIELQIFLGKNVIMLFCTCQ